MTGPNETFVAAARAALVERADPVRAVGQQRYMKSAMPYHGLTSPELRRALTPILREVVMGSHAEWLATIEALWSRATHREQWYAALALARHRPYRGWLGPEAMALWERLIREGAWWDVVDDIATHLVRDTLLAAPDVEADRIRGWAQHESMWMRRAAILCQVGAGDRLDEDLLSDVIRPNVADREFFIRKAIGWALRDHARVAPGWVLRFVGRQSDLSQLSRREALKHVGLPA
ncbi:MAG: DNA alkylation repair protein [Intrasporangium sp.]|uniref:DNA alkylation repair protein n=1 Tax=Intrasporangium sp. TaxID=1925024 RepID=UPI0026486911|nr:DNA alkylation repair protein [Intrasporangium sp.]MDN5795837.1 DNA alkylation repair protein [Intrasporangium sp.]